MISTRMIPFEIFCLACEVLNRFILFHSADRPFSIAPPATARLNQPNPGDPYAYYGLRHPLEPDPQTGMYNLLIKHGHVSPS